MLAPSHSTDLLLLHNRFRTKESKTSRSVNQLNRLTCFVGPDEKLRCRCWLHYERGVQMSFSFFNQQTPAKRATHHHHHHHLYYYYYHLSFACRRRRRRRHSKNQTGELNFWLANFSLSQLIQILTANVAAGVIS